MVQDRAIFTMADQKKVAYGLSNGAIFNDLELPLSNLDFKVTQIFDVEYGINGTK